MSRRLVPLQETRKFRFEFNGHSVEAGPDDTVASALIASGHDIFSRSIKYHRPRGAYCLSGRCSNCLVRIDGVANLYACTTPARADVSVSVQNTLLPSAKVDLLETIDWVFPRGLDHHEMFAGVPVVEDVMAKVARKLAGLGELPDRVAPAGPPAEVRSVDVAIVGGGAAGLACAEALAGSGLTVEVVEEQPKVGGRALLGLESARDPDWARAAAERCLSAGIRVTTGATVLGVYRDEGVRVLPLLRRGDDRLQKLVCRSLVLANGSSEPMTPFTGNDLPGVYAGRGLARMLLQQRVTPGGQAVVVGSTDETLGLAHLLRASGVEVEALVDPAARLSSGDFRVLSGHSPSRCRGISAVRGLVVTDGAGRRERLKCDVVALCDLPAPAFELGRQAGAHVAFDAAKGGFALQAEDGRTAAPGVFAAGDVTGVGSVARAREQGAAVGRLLARTAGASA